MKTQGTGTRISGCTPARVACNARSLRALSDQRPTTRPHAIAESATHKPIIRRARMARYVLVRSVRELVGYLDDVGDRLGIGAASTRGLEPERGDFFLHCSSQELVGRLHDAERSHYRAAIDAHCESHH